MSTKLEEWKKEANLLEPHHEYKEAEPSRSGKRGVRCILCGYYTNGMERGNFSPCPNHASFRMKILIKRDRLMTEALKKYMDATKLTFWHRDDMQIAKIALDEAEKILEEI